MLICERFALLCFALAMSLSAPAAERFFGKVIGITDGDTLTLLTSDKEQVKIRLSEIDTPERGQPYGTRSRQALGNLVFGKRATVYSETTDRYGRIVARVVVGETDVNAEMVRSGHAWVYRQYANREVLYELEESARNAERGMWSLPESQRVPPWKWRELRREGKSIQEAVSDEAQSRREEATFECGTKRYCGDMSTCKEARYFLTECGVLDLDRDKDGLPCESICK